jgi:GTPase SAR1 family protein
MANNIDIHQLPIITDMALLLRHQSKASRMLDASGHIIGLNLCDCTLDDSFLSQLNEFTHLQALNLSHNAFESIELSDELTALRFVDFSDCTSLRSLKLPRTATALERLDVSDAALEALVLPNELRKLEYLDASRNKLTRLELPHSAMPGLVHLDLSGNDIKDLALPDIYNSLKYLYLGDCELSGVPAAIYKEHKNSSQELKTYFEATKSGEVLNAEAKFIFFGNGEAGKTTLSKQLREGIFEKTEGRTHGILVWEWAIDQKDFPQKLHDKIAREIEKYQQEHPDRKILRKPERILLNVWDFGGQEYFHATHRLFLSDNVLYMVVWETATDRSNEATGDYPRKYWVDNIAHYAPKHTILYVQNKAGDAAAFDAAKKEYKVALRNDNSPRSLQQYNLDVDFLKEKVLEELPQLDYMAQPIVKVYDDIRTEVKRIKTEKKVLSFTDFEALCRAVDTTEARIMQDDANIQQVTDFLHETGCLICYRFKKDKKSEKLDDYVFINSGWVTETIYKILDEKTLENNGEFDKKHVISVLEQERSDLSDANLWIELMQEFELIFAKKDQPDQFIAPQYLPETCKDLSEKALNNLLERLPYQLVLHYPEFLPRSIISRFICRYGNLAKDEYWKYGIVLHQNKEEIYVVCDHKAQNITIRSATRYSDFALELLDVLKNIDNTPTLEIAVSDANDPQKMIDPVNFAKLQQESSKEREQVEWRDQWFDLSHFKGLFRHEKEFLGSDSHFKTRDIAKIPPAISAPIAEIMEVPMEANSRNFIPFPNIQGKISLLYLAASPIAYGQLNTGRESRFKDLIKYFDEEKRFHVIEQHGITKEQFRNFVLSDRPHILHYGGHGTEKGILLEDGLLKEAILLGILTISTNTQCVILNACNSLEIALELAKHIPYIVGTRYPIPDATSIEFARGFYQALVTGYSVEDAFQSGILAVQDNELLDPDVLVLVKGVKTGASTPVAPPAVTVVVPPVVVPVAPLPPPPVALQAPSTAKKAFFCYSQKDRAYLDAFLKRLAPLRRNGKIQAWEDDLLKGGEEWDAAIKQNLAAADLIFLLLSHDFLSTDYIWDVEIKIAMERYERGEAIIIPIVLRPCDWKGSIFSKLNALPSKGTAISTYEDKDAAWLEVVNRIKQLLP